MGKKQTSSPVSSLAARVLQGYEPTRREIETLAASALSQDETPGIVRRTVARVFGK